MASEDFAQALRRFGGMWFSAWRDGRMLTDTVQVTATTQRARIEVPLVGQQRVGYKPGRTSSEGSIAFQKIDTSWELEVYNALTVDVEELRAQRDVGNFATLGGFDLILKHDDPHAYGKETWKLQGCQIWQYDLGGSNADDFVQREIPLTFEKAVPLQTFEVVDGAVNRVHTLQG